MTTSGKRSDGVPERATTSFDALMAAIQRSRHLNEMIIRHREVAPDLLVLIIALAEAAANIEAREGKRG